MYEYRYTYIYIYIYIYVYTHIVPIVYIPQNGGVVETRRSRLRLRFLDSSFSSLSSC